MTSIAGVDDPIVFVDVGSKQKYKNAIAELTEAQLLVSDNKHKRIKDIYFGAVKKTELNKGNELTITVIAGHNEHQYKIISGAAEQFKQTIDVGGSRQRQMHCGDVKHEFNDFMVRAFKGAAAPNQGRQSCWDCLKNMQCTDLKDIRTESLLKERGSVWDDHSPQVQSAHFQGQSAWDMIGDTTGHSTNPCDGTGAQFSICFYSFKKRPPPPAASGKVKPRAPPPDASGKVKPQPPLRAMDVFYGDNVVDYDDINYLPQRQIIRDQYINNNDILLTMYGCLLFIFLSIIFCCFCAFIGAVMGYAVSRITKTKKLSVNNDASLNQSEVI